MYHGIFDTHAHYDHENFDYIRHATLSSMPSLGVSLIVNCGSDEDSSLYSMELAEEYSFLYFSAGIHPHESAPAKDGWDERIKKMLAHPKAVAVGEIGLDYYYDFSDHTSQRKVFARSLELAVELDLPVIVHDRGAHDDILAMLREYRPKGVVHRYSGDPAMAEQLIDLGLFLGFGCAITYKNAADERATLETLSLEHLLLETDCPYLPPHQLRNELCRSDMISYAAETIAEIRPDYTPQQIIDIARKNGERLFSVSGSTDWT